MAKLSYLAITADSQVKPIYDKILVEQSTVYQESQCPLFFFLQVLHLSINLDVVLHESAEVVIPVGDDKGVVLLGFGGGAFVVVGGGSLHCGCRTRGPGGCGPLVSPGFNGCGGTVLVGNDTPTRAEPCAPCLGPGERGGVT